MEAGLNLNPTPFTGLEWWASSCSVPWARARGWRGPPSRRSRAPTAAWGRTTRASTVSEDDRDIEIIFSKKILLIGAGTDSNLTNWPHYMYSLCLDNRSTVLDFKNWTNKQIGQLRGLTEGCWLTKRGVGDQAKLSWKRDVCLNLSALSLFYILWLKEGFLPLWSTFKWCPHQKDNGVRTLV